MVLLLGKMSHVCEKSMCSTFIGGEFFESVKVVSVMFMSPCLQVLATLQYRELGYTVGPIPSSPSSVLTATVLFRAC